MMKLIPLYVVHCKEFLRNYKSVFILLGTPLLIILIIFLSISQSQLTKIPIGYTSDIAITTDLRNFLESSFVLSEYASLPSCTQSMNKYKNYACIDIVEQNQLTVTIVYDNTRDPVSWEILQLLKFAIDAYRQQQSVESINSF
jgi:hypothetical protein